MTRHFQRWSREDDHLLRELWGKGTAIAKIAAKLHRKTPAVYARAKKCRLTSRPPLGFETFTAAAKRSGLDHGALHKALARAGVKVLFRQVEPRPGRWKRRCLIVRRSEVNRAVALSSAAESASAAARRLGIAKSVFMRKVHRAGIETNARRLYLSEHQIQEVMAA